MNNGRTFCSDYRTEGRGRTPRSRISLPLSSFLAWLTCRGAGDDGGQLVSVKIRDSSRVGICVSMGVGDNGTALRRASPIYVRSDAACTYLIARCYLKHFIYFFYFLLPRLKLSPGVGCTEQGWAASHGPGSPLAGPWAGFFRQVSWPRATHAIRMVSGLTGLRSFP